jgi:hypothetical protein
MQDNTCGFVDNLDTTKRMEFQCGSVTTGTTRTLTVPDRTGVIVTEALIQSTSASEPIGYQAGAGGAVSQITSINTGVTINRPSGRITMQGTIPAATTSQFVVTNSAISNDDVVVLSMSNNPGVAISMEAVNVANGQFSIRFTNFDATNATTASPIINFAVVKVATS